MFIAKFKVQSVQHFENDNIQVVMCPVMGENPFSKYTPNGQIQFTCCNPEVNKQLEPGKVFEITFNESTPVRNEDTKTPSITLKATGTLSIDN